MFKNAPGVREEKKPVINEEGRERETRPGKKVKEKGKEVVSRLLTGTQGRCSDWRAGRCGTKRRQPTVPYWEEMRSESPELRSAAV